MVLIISTWKNVLRGYSFCNTPEGNIMAAAKWALQWLSIFRNIPQAHYAAKNKDFRRNQFIGEELDGKVAGIIGLGRIGSIVAKTPWSRNEGCWI